MAWNPLAYSYLTRPLFIQILADPTEQASVSSALLFTTQLSMTPIPTLTRLEIPLIILIASILTSVHPDDPFGNDLYWEPFVALKRLDLRAAAAPPLSDLSPKWQSLRHAHPVDLWRRRLSRTRFPILETIHMVDMTLAKLTTVLTQFTLVCRELDIQIYDKHGAMLTEDMFVHLSIGG